ATAHLNECRHRHSCSRGINARLVAGDDTRLFEPTDSLRDGWRRHADASPQLLKRKPPVWLKFFADLPIGVVELSFRLKSHGLRFPYTRFPLLLLSRATRLQIALMRA